MKCLIFCAKSLTIERNLKFCYILRYFTASSAQPMVSTISTTKKPIIHHIMRSSFFGSRLLKVETSPQPQQPMALSNRSPAAIIKSPANTVTTPRFMTSTASSMSKTTSRLIYAPDPTTSEHLDTTEKLMQDLIRFTRSR